MPKEVQIVREINLKLEEMNEDLITENLKRCMIQSQPGAEICYQAFKN